MRIYASNNDPIDFCDTCSPNETEALERFGNWGDGPDNRGDCFAYDADHPSYDENDYFCFGCHVALWL